MNKEPNKDTPEDFKNDWEEITENVVSSVLGTGDVKIIVTGVS